MIQLTRLNGNPMVLNSDLIKTAEASPDTMLTLVNGEKIIVRESCSEVTERVLSYRARLLSIVARRLPSYEEVRSVVSLASLDYEELGRCLLAAVCGALGVWFVFTWLLDKLSQALHQHALFASRPMEFVVLLAGTTLWLAIAKAVLEKSGSSLPAVAMKRLHLR